MSRLLDWQWLEGKRARGQGGKGARGQTPESRKARKPESAFHVSRFTFPLTIHNHQLQQSLVVVLALSNET